MDFELEPTFALRAEHWLRFGLACALVGAACSMQTGLSATGTGGGPDAGAAGSGDAGADAGHPIQGASDSGPSSDAGPQDGGVGQAPADGGAVNDGGSADAGTVHGGDAGAARDAGTAGDAGLAGDAGDAGGCPTGYWCSQLFPPGWMPDASADSQGRFMPDFSYAGYHGGEPPPTSVPGATYDAVVGYGADPTGATDSTAAIQAAIDAAQAADGGVVFIPAGLYQCAGVLNVTSSGVVLRGAGQGQTQIYFSLTTNMSYLSHITFTGTLVEGSDIPLAADGVERSNQVAVGSTTGLSIGDEIHIGWVITDAFVAAHGMTGTWTAFNGLWEPFFRRTIVAIDDTASPPILTVDVPLRYPALMSDSASVRVSTGYLHECGIEHMSVSDAVNWTDAWGQNQVHVIEFNGVEDSWVNDVGTFASPLGTTSGPTDTNTYDLQNGGTLVLASKRVTEINSTMANAQNRGSGGDGYLFEISQSNEILISDSLGQNGRHNFIQNWGFGATGCVFLRCTSVGGAVVTPFLGLYIATPGYSQTHHSLAMSILVDESSIQDEWQAVNRGLESTGAGQTSTEGVVWNVTGGGTIESMNYGWGYVIGTDPNTTVDTALVGPDSVGTAPQDWVEGAGIGSTLWPQSLYEQQRAIRLGYDAGAG